MPDLYDLFGHYGYIGVDGPNHLRYYIRVVSECWLDPLYRSCPMFEDSYLDAYHESATDLDWLDHRLDSSYEDAWELGGVDTSDDYEADDRESDDYYDDEA